MFFCILLRRAYMVSQILLKPEKLPIIAKKTENPKVKVSQKSSGGQKSSSFYRPSLDKREKIMISANITGGGANPPGTGDAIDGIIIGLLDKRGGRGTSGPTVDPGPGSVSDGTEGGHRVQIIALRNSQQAANYVSRTKKLYGDMLKNLNVFVDELNLGEKGMFFRVQIGRFATREAAMDFCENFLKRGADGSANCILVR
ncbi:MAG: SPOR domain-containing protein [Rickettsiales bacterium]|nr:SPOR domain-containing protein [Rickettsiales bacterium]